MAKGISSAGNFTREITFLAILGMIRIWVFEALPYVEMERISSACNFTREITFLAILGIIRIWVFEALPYVEMEIISSLRYGFHLFNTFHFLCF